MAAGSPVSVAAGKKALPGGMAAGLCRQSDCVAYSAAHRYQQVADTRLIFLPAAGNRNNTSVNNQGSNGYYWSSTPSPSNALLAYYVGFYSGGLSPANFDYHRSRGYSVRLVRQFE